MAKKTLLKTALILLAAHSAFFYSPTKATPIELSDITLLNTVVAAGAVAVVGTGLWLIHYGNTHADEITARATEKLCKKIEEKYEGLASADLYHAAHVEVANAGTGLTDLIFRPKMPQDTRIRNCARGHIQDDLNKLFKHEKAVTDLLQFHQKQIKKAECGDNTIDIDVKKHRYAEKALGLQLEQLRVIENKLLNLINEVCYPLEFATY